MVLAFSRSMEDFCGLAADAQGKLVAACLQLFMCFSASASARSYQSRHQARSRRCLARASNVESEMDDPDSLALQLGLGKASAWPTSEGCPKVFRKYRSSKVC